MTGHTASALAALAEAEGARADATSGKRRGYANALGITDAQAADIAWGWDRPALVAEGADAAWRGAAAASDRLSRPS